LENPWIARKQHNPQNSQIENPFSSSEPARLAQVLPNYNLAVLGDFNGLEREKFGNAFWKLWYDQKPFVLLESRIINEKRLQAKTLFATSLQSLDLKP
jgi:hypothetical protein